MSNGDSKKPLALVAGKGEKLREVTEILTGGEGYRIETANPGKIEPYGDEPGCVVTDDAGLIEEVDGDGGIPTVLVSDGSTRVSDAVDAGATEYVETPVGDADGRLLRRRVERYIQDTREGQNRREETEPQIAKRRHEAFFNDPDVPVAILDTDGNVLDANPKSAEYTEGEPDDVVGKPFWETDLWGTDERDPIMEKVRRASEGEYVGYEVEDTDTGAKGYVGTGSVRPVTDESGEVTSVIVSSRGATGGNEREAELERNRDLLKHTERISDTGGWELDVETGEQRWTDGTRGIHGVSDEYEPTVGDGIAFYHPDDRGRIERLVENCIQNAEPYDAKLRMVTADGEVRWVRTVGEPVEEDGEVTKIQGAIQDITELKRHETQLERYEKLWKKIPVGVCRVEADNSGRFLTANERMVEMTGAGSEEELLGLSTDDFWIDEEERKGLAERTEQNGWVTTERRFRSLDGRVVWARITVIAQDTDEDTVFDAVVQDITDRHQREEQLKKAQEIADIGSWYKNIPSDEIHWSDRLYDLWGVECEGSVDYGTFLEYIHPDDRGFVDSSWQEAKEGEPYDIEHRIVRDDGEERWMRETADVTFEDGEAVNAIGVVQDITERKQRENQIERRKQQVEFFNSLLRHEMLNSMTVIRGSTRTALDSLPQDHCVYEDLTRVYDRSDEIVDLINRVRSVLRRISGEGRELAQKNLSDTVEKRVASLENRHRVDTRLDLPGEVYVEADKFLGDVVDNILDNAVEHNDKDEPRVEVSVEQDSGTVTLRIADNGSGIPDERKEEVFRQGVTGKTGGKLGFGLYFVKSMVSEYGGEVRVEDNEPDGAVLVVELPTVDGVTRREVQG